ncbi:hypothetical protein J4480_05905 [Candidatus Woesearchaeota archaeon]|nr:hypothetical protein [Candidatus Woesearchaeota archaeon]
MHKLPNMISKILPAKTEFNPIFHKNPSIKGHATGLVDSHNPALPKE